MSWRHFSTRTLGICAFQLSSGRCCLRQRHLLIQNINFEDDWAQLCSLLSSSGSSVQSILFVFLIEWNHSERVIHSRRNLHFHGRDILIQMTMWLFTRVNEIKVKVEHGQTDAYCRDSMSKCNEQDIARGQMSKEKHICFICPIKIILCMVSFSIS